MKSKANSVGKSEAATVQNVVVLPPFGPLFPIEGNSRELRVHNARAGLEEGDEEFSP